MDEEEQKEEGEEEEGEEEGEKEMRRRKKKINCKEVYWCTSALPPFLRFTL